MAFVYKDQVVVREIIEQGRGRLARGTARNVSGIVFNAVAVAQLLDHFHVIVGALLDPLGFYELAGVSEMLDTVF